jgi:mono/diheme cytochrome c family protein
MRLWSGLLLAGCQARDLRIEAVVELEGDAVSGEATFDEHCSDCHGYDGITIGALSAEQMAEQILWGGSETVYAYMPAFEGTLSDQEIADVIAYLTDTSM